MKVREAADRAREEEAVKTKEQQEEKCKNAKKKCLDRECQEKADKKILLYLESE